MKEGVKQGGIGLVVALVIIAIVGIGGYASIKTVQKTKMENQKMMDEAKKMMEDGEKMMAENEAKAMMLKAEVKTVLDGISAEMEANAEVAVASSTEALMSLKSKLADAYDSAEGDMKMEIGEMQTEVNAMIDKMDGEMKDEMEGEMKDKDMDTSASVDAEVKVE